MKSLIKSFCCFFGATFFTVAFLTVARSPCETKIGKVDLDYRYIRSIEWLVDNSDAIMMVEYDDEEDQSPTVLHEFKGSKTEIKFPIIFVGPDKAKAVDFSAQGKRRILFIRNDSQLLSQVDISRQLICGPVGHAHELLFGITQFGEAILTEGALFSAIEQRISNPSSENDVLKCSRQSFVFNDVLGGIFVGGPPQFFLDHDDWLFMIQVPHTIERRDYFLELANRSTHPQEVMWAIRELRYFDDGGKARKTLERVANDTSRKLTPASLPGGSAPISLLDVRRKAWRAIHGSDSKLE